MTALRMERDENNQRVDLTPSEKVALGKKIEDTLAGRNHRPIIEKLEEESRQNFAQLKNTNEEPPQAQGRSADIAAQAVGMNRETYRQAKAVVDSGNRDAIEAMGTCRGVVKHNATHPN